MITFGDLFISLCPMLLSLILIIGTKHLSDIKPRHLIRQRNRYAAMYGQQDDLIQLIGRRLLERLELVTISPELILDLASYDGSSSRQLKERYRSARVIGCEPGIELAKLAKQQSGWFRKPGYITAMPDMIPVKDNCVDLVVVNLYPVWFTDVSRLFREINRVLSADGLLLFTSMGPDSLMPIRSAWQTADPDFEHLLAFNDMHDIGDALTRTGFHNIVMENEPLTIEYATVSSLHDDLRRTAHANLSPDRRSGLLGKQRYQAYLNALEEFKSPTLNITYDMVFGHGWKGIKQPKHAINALPDQFESIPFKSLD